MVQFWVSQEFPRHSPLQRAVGVDGQDAMELNHSLSDHANDAKKLVCNHTTSGKWMPSGMRASEDHWVANASMAQGFRLLSKCRAAKSKPGASLAVIEKSITKARLQELALEKQQRLIEDRAYFGLDGPRPCMYMGGKPM
ncbi:hypothetical protein BSKO_01416 [Bryopsis sp. KO-2023]|nr:hypothetical protein BSKO_01416 [Bryopsis sp. KO-2023]